MQDQVALGAQRSPTPVKGGIARVPWLTSIVGVGQTMDVSNLDDESEALMVRERGVSQTDS